MGMSSRQGVWVQEKPGDLLLLGKWPKMLLKTSAVTEDSLRMRRGPLKRKFLGRFCWWSILLTFVWKVFFLFLYSEKKISQGLQFFFSLFLFKIYLFICSFIIVFSQYHLSPQTLFHSTDPPQPHCNHYTVVHEFSLFYLILIYSVTVVPDLLPLPSSTKPTPWVLSLYFSFLLNHSTPTPTPQADRKQGLLFFFF